MKRGRESSQQEEPAAGSGQPQPNEGSNPQDRAQTRRDDMKQIARRRAAHFANYTEEDPTDGANPIHAGGEEARTLGPWSSAVELVNAREQAAELRRQRMAGMQDGDDAGQGEEDAEAEKLIQAIADWTPSRDPACGPRPRSRVPRLFEMCVALLVEHVECIDSLAGVPDVMRVQLAEAVCAKCKLEPEVSALFAVDTPGEVVLPSCVCLDPAAISSLIEECVTPRLERLELGFCGRGFGDAEADLFARTATRNGASMLTSFTSLLLGGAYRLTDGGLQKVLSVCPRLQQLSLPQASRITSATLSSLAVLGPTLRNLDLTECRGLGSTELCQLLPQLTCLERLVLDGVNPETADSVVLAAASIPTLRALSLSMSTSVTDVGLVTLAAKRPGLTELRLDWCSKVSDAGVLAVAEGCKGLQVLSLRRCARLSDEAVSAVARNGRLQRLAVSNVHAFGPLSMAALASCCSESLEYLDISFCRAVSDAAFGLVADSCQQLRQAVLYGCSQITSKSLHGHTNEFLACNGIEGSYHQASA